MSQVNCMSKKEQCEKKKHRRIIIFVITIIAFIITIIIGTVCYFFLFNLPWIDAFYNASLILTGIDVETTPTTTGQKIFISVYAIVSILLLVSLANIATQRIYEIFINSD